MATMDLSMDLSTAKAQPYAFDLGHLLVTDPNPLPELTAANKEAILSNVARDCAQNLINQLLSACPIKASPESDGRLQIHLPAPETLLPREKPVPKEKEKTKWDKFAAKKGIKPKSRDGKLEYDEEKGDWVPKYGYKGKKTGAGDDWLVEVDDRKEKAGKGEDNGPRPNRQARMNALRKERKERSRKAKDGK